MFAQELRDWKDVRGKTLEFLELLPQEHMSWRPHEQLGTFGMQLRHLAKVQEAYLVGMKTGTITFTDKQFDAAIETDKSAALRFLEQVEADMQATLAAMDDTMTVQFIDSAGERTISLRTVLQYLINHEIYHQGIFTCYGRLAGLGKFTFL